METMKIWPGWEIKEQVGEGDIGKVFRIERTDAGITREAALKVIEISGDSAEIKKFRKMGMDEESILEIYEDRKNQLLAAVSRLSCLSTAYGIASIEDYDSRWNEEDSVWTILIRSEFLESLDAYGKKKGGDLLPTEIAEMGRDIAGALMTLEKEGITSLSVKPSNILRNSEGSYKLSDAWINEGTGILANWKIGGLFAWDAPELVRSGKYDQTSDIYSLGMIMYVLLNGGKLPFMEEGGEVKRWMKIKIANEKRVSGEQLPNPVHGDNELQNIVLKACAPKPEDRYQNALELREALEIWLFGQKYGKALIAEEAVLRARPSAEPEKAETAGAPSESEADSSSGAAEPEERTSFEPGDFAAEQPESAEAPMQSANLSEPMKVVDLITGASSMGPQVFYGESSDRSEEGDPEAAAGENAGERIGREGIQLMNTFEEEPLPERATDGRSERISLFKKSEEEQENNIVIKEEIPSVSVQDEDVQESAQDEDVQDSVQDEAVHEKEPDPFGKDFFNAPDSPELPESSAGEPWLNAGDTVHSRDVSDHFEEGAENQDELPGMPPIFSFGEESEITAPLKDTDRSFFNDSDPVIRTDGPQPGQEGSFDDIASFFKPGADLDEELPKNEDPFAAGSSQPGPMMPEFTAERSEPGPMMPEFTAERPEPGPMMPEFTAEKPEPGPMMPEFTAERSEPGPMMPEFTAERSEPEPAMPIFTAGNLFGGEEHIDVDEDPYGATVAEMPNLEAAMEPVKEEIPPTADVFIYIFQREDKLVGIHSRVSENGGGARIKMKSEVLETGLFETILDNLRNRSSLPIENAYVTIESGASKAEYEERREMVLAAGLKSVEVVDDAAVNALGIFEELTGQVGEHYVLSVIHNYDGFHSSLLKFDTHEGSEIRILKSVPSDKVVNPMENPAFIMDRKLQENCNVDGIDYSNRVERILVDDRNRPLMGSVGQGSFDPYYNAVYGSIFQKANLYEGIEALKGLAFYRSCKKGEKKGVNASLSVFEEPVKAGNEDYSADVRGDFGANSGAGPHGNDPFVSGDMPDPNSATMASSKSGADPFVAGGDNFGGNADPFSAGGINFGGNEDPFAAGGNNYGGNADPFSTGENNFGGNADPFSAGGINFGGNEDPFAAGGNNFGGSSDPFSTGGNNFGGNADPFTAGGNDFGGNADPFSAGGNNFGGNADPFVAGGNNFGGSSDPFSTGGNNFGGSSDPFSTGGNNFGGNADPFTAGGNNFGGSSDPFSTGGNDFGGSADPFSAGGAANSGSPDFMAGADMFNGTAAGTDFSGQTSTNAANGSSPFGGESAAAGSGGDSLSDTAAGNAFMGESGESPENRALNHPGIRFSDRGRVYILGEKKPFNDVTVEVNEGGIDFFRKDKKVTFMFGAIGSAIEGKGKKFAHIDFAEIRRFGYETPNLETGPKPALYTAGGKVYIFDFVRSENIERMLQQIVGSNGGPF